MRYYDVRVTSEAGELTKHWTSHPGGINSPPDAGALKIEVDAFNVAQGVPLPGSFVRVWGISLDDIGRASDLNGHDLTLRGGMGKGLPLANPKQAGIIIQGHIQQAFANWIGTTMTLDMLLVAGTVSSGTGAAQNIVVDWPPNTKMSQMLSNLLGRLFPKAKLSINIDPKLVLPYREAHFAGTMAQLAEYLIESSRRIINTGPALTGQWNTPNNALSKYPGVQLLIDGDAIKVYDGSQPSVPKQISIYDLIGQPTWIGPQTIQVSLVARGDIRVGDFIKLPPTRAIVTPASLSAYSRQRQDILFQGTFMVNQVHVVLNYKDPGPLAWVTIIDAAIQTETDADGQARILTSTGGGDEAASTGSFGGIGPNPAPSSGFSGLPGEGGAGADAAAVGLVGPSPAPSGGFSGVPGEGSAQTAGGVVGSVSATAGDVRLKQSAPAPSLIESVNQGAVGSPF